MDIFKGLFVFNCCRSAVGIISSDTIGNNNIVISIRNRVLENSPQFLNDLCNHISSYRVSVVVCNFISTIIDAYLTYQRHMISHLLLRHLYIMSCVANFFVFKISHIIYEVNAKLFENFFQIFNTGVVGSLSYLISFLCEYGFCITAAFIAFIPLFYIFSVYYQNVNSFLDFEDATIRVFIFHLGSICFIEIAVNLLFVVGFTIKEVLNSLTRFNNGLVAEDALRRPRVVAEDGLRIPRDVVEAELRRRFSLGNIAEDELVQEISQYNGVTYMLLNYDRLVGFVKEKEDGSNLVFPGTSIKNEGGEDLINCLISHSKLQKPAMIYCGHVIDEESLKGCLRNRFACPCCRCNL